MMKLLRALALLLLLGAPALAEPPIPSKNVWANNSGSLAPAQAVPYLQIIAGCAVASGGCATTFGLISTSATALQVGLGLTNPALNVDTSTASSVTGLNVKSATAGNGVVLQSISSGTNEGISLNAKGSGVVAIGNLSTGGVSLTSPVTASLGYQIGGAAPSGHYLRGNGTNYIDQASATAAQYFAGTAGGAVEPPTIYQAETTTTFGATTTFDFSTFINTAVTLTGNITTQTLSNVKAGQAGMITFIQDGTGSRTTVWNSIFKFPGGIAPVLTSTPAAIDVLTYSCRSASICVASLMLNVK